MNSVYFITGNRMKASEAREILAGFGIMVQNKKLKIDEMQDPNAQSVAVKKAEDAFRVIKKPLFVEDTGLYIKSMHGYPGTMIKHFFDSIGPRGIVDFLNNKDRTAEAVTVVAFADNKGKVVTFKGVVKGKISDHVSESRGFHWDSIFIPEGYDITYAEMGQKEKNRISQRRKALEKFAKWLLKSR